MDYRGQDLDLRTSRWSASSTEPSGWREAAAAGAAAGAVHSTSTAVRPVAHRPSPIWVDETLLACANHAYDVALAYRSAEVRLEHLMLAMTRVEAAAAALEVRGVRVASLRRDSAVAIAGELPATNGDGNVSSAPLARARGRAAPCRFARCAYGPRGERRRRRAGAWATSAAICPAPS